MTEPARPSLVQAVGLRSATALVVASMIGAGIFTTTGFQAADLGHPSLAGVDGADLLGALVFGCSAEVFAQAAYS